ncbi:MAG: SsrA-binding protein SmpB [Paracoccaceae bacterium]|jgi:SsrA-binding protein
MAAPKSDPNYKVIAENRRARFDYAIEDDLECGVALLGSEVKSLRVNSSNIAESYAGVDEGELWLVNSYIAPYEQAKTFGHEERRRRKLLVSRRELARLWSDTQRKGMTLVPLVMYFNHRGKVKLKIGIAKGKKNHDKRADQAKRDWGRQKQRLLRHGD